MQEVGGVASARGCWLCSRGFQGGCNATHFWRLWTVILGDVVWNSRCRRKEGIGRVCLNVDCVARRKKFVDMKKK